MNVAGEIKEALLRAAVSLSIEMKLEDIPLEHTDDFANGDYASGIALSRAKVAQMAPRFTFSADMLQFSRPNRRRSVSIARKLAPASTSAPRTMSPLMPEKQSKYAIPTICMFRRRMFRGNAKK